MTREKCKPKILKQELVAESRLFKVESLHLRFTNGTERIYERMQGGHRGAVMLVPLLDDETLGITVRGVERYRLHRVEVAADGLLIGEVTPLPNWQATELAPQQDVLAHRHATPPSVSCTTPSTGYSVGAMGVTSAGAAASV